MRKTKNGAVALKTTGNACLDMFAFAGSARKHPARLVSQFQRAYRENPRLALRLLLWLRDVRGGAGERLAFRYALHWLDRVHPDIAVQLIPKITELGRWDDLLTLASPVAREAVAHHVKHALTINPTGQGRLCAKWMPRDGRDAAWLRNALGLSASQWRRQLALLSDTVEQKLCRRSYEAIALDQVPSVAAARYKATFARRCSPRYQAYLEDVLAGRAGMHAGAIFPHDIAKAAAVDDVGATAQWAQIPKPAIAGNALVVADVSGSMTSRIGPNLSAMDVCLALSLLLAESLPGAFHNKVITFSEAPTLFEIKGKTLGQKLAHLKSAPWGMNTNFQRVFDLVLANCIQGAPCPSAILVLSDMEFDAAQKNRLNHAVIARKFEAAGIPMPTLVYWNIAGTGGHQPTSNVPGAVMLSGFSPAVLNSLLTHDVDTLQQMTPESAMLEVLSAARYDIQGLTS